MQKNVLLAAATAIGLLTAGVANAAITVQAIQEKDNLFGGTGTPGAGDPYTSLQYGQTMLYDFDGIDVNVSYAGTVKQGPQIPIGNSAPPPYLYSGALDGLTPVLRDETKYASVQANETGVFRADAGYLLSSFSFYLGSPDSYNRVTFWSGNYVVGQFDGKTIWDAATFGGDDNGDRSWGYRVYYDFDGALVDKITFNSFGADAMESDGFAGTLVAVPEPSSWALMIIGFGGVGAMLRRRHAAVVA